MLLWIDLLNFNPIIGLILTWHFKEDMPLFYKFQSHYRSDFNINNQLDETNPNPFQSHYRSDFNFNISSVEAYKTYFNPIIGLILTGFCGLLLSVAFNFNPIIGLILTWLINLYWFFIVWFQSHYRSDFNYNTICQFSVFSIFQSHYRSDFNCYNRYTLSIYYYYFNPIIGLILTPIWEKGII